MTDEVRLVLQLSLNLAAIPLAAWLAARYAARRMQKALEIERQRAEEARRRAQAEIVASLPPIPPEVEKMVEVERWTLAARDLQLLLTSLCTLIRIRLRADAASQPSVFTEIERSLKSLSRQENKWLNASLRVTAYARQLDPAGCQTYDQSLETWISSLNQAYLQAAQSLRRAACLADPDSQEAHNDTSINTYVTEAEQASAILSSHTGSALDRLAYLKQQLPSYQAQQVAMAVAGRLSEDSQALNGSISQ